MSSVSNVLALGVGLLAYGALRTVVGALDVAASLHNSYESGRRESEREEAIREKAKRIDAYIQKWILDEGTVVTLFQCPEKWLRVSVKNTRSGVDFTAPLLEPQTSEIKMVRAIERVKEFYPHVDAKNATVSFKQNLKHPDSLQIKTEVIKTWDLTDKQVRDTLERNRGLDPGKLSLINEDGYCYWKFFAENSRTVSFKNIWYFEKTQLEKGLEHYNIEISTETELDHRTAITYGKYSYSGPPCWKRATKISEVRLQPIQYPSKLDPEKLISVNDWAVTLIAVQPKKGPAHAEILFEKISQNGHLFQIADLQAVDPLLNVKQYCGKGGKTQVSREMTFDELKPYRNSEVWIRPAIKIQSLISKIKSQGTVLFHLLGKDSMIAKIAHKDPCHNCTTWAKEQLGTLDIKLPDRFTDLFLTHPSQYLC